MSLTVLEPGLFSLLVDFGRTGGRDRGVPVGGAADRAALALGNALLGNSPATLALELTLAGPTLRADGDVACVVYGAPFSVTIVGRQSVEAGTTFQLRAGDVLKIGGTPAGVRGYLCVGGGFDGPTLFGSRSALTPIAVGAVLPCLPGATAGRSFPFVSPNVPDGPTELRVVDGPQRDWFPDDAFFTQPYTVGTAGNRMGVRLTGEPLRKRAGELVSEPVAPGAVQVTNDGLPIVLGVDGQTIGGYPKVAHVIRADLDRVAQLRPGTAVRFRHISLEEAEVAGRDRREWLREWLARAAVATPSRHAAPPLPGVRREFD